MCDQEVPCFHETPLQEFRPLTLLMLDCWQREYDKRPYRNFTFDRLQFEQRMQRLYDPVRDLITIVEFINKRSLLSLKLVGLQIVSQTCELIQQFIVGLSNLQEIVLKYVDLPNEFFVLLESNVDKMKVKMLVLKGSPLTDFDIVYLRSFLIKSKSVQHLDVASCSINQFNFAILADAIHKSTSILSFNASRLLGKGLTLDSEKIVHTLSSLIWQNKLQTIEMENCEFIAQDMEVISEYLYEKNCSLLKLNVAYNRIGPDGARYLLEAISASGTLKHLNMNGCGLGNHGGEYVAKYLSSCSRLETLLLQSNGIDGDTVSMILLTMKKPQKLNRLYLWDNKYNPRTGSILRRLISSRVLEQDSVDITYTFDDTIPGWRIIPWR